AAPPPAGRSPARATPGSTRRSRCCATCRCRLDELKLRGAREPLDTRLFAQRGGSIGNRDHSHELNRSAAARVAAGSARTVCRQSALDIGRPPAVQRIIGTAAQIDGRQLEWLRQEDADYLLPAAARIALGIRVAFRPATGCLPPH